MRGNSGDLNLWPLDNVSSNVTSIDVTSINEPGTSVQSPEMPLALIDPGTGKGARKTGLKRKTEHSNENICQSHRSCQSTYQTGQGASGIASPCQEVGGQSGDVDQEGGTCGRGQRGRG